MSFLLGNGDGTFRRGPQTLKIADVPQGIAVGDFNRDGKIDVAVSGYFGSVSVFPGNGDGSFGPAVTLSVGATGAGLAVGDVNGDGNPDIVVGGGSSESAISLGVFLLTGNGDLTFNAPVELLADEAPNGVVLADFNGDGLIDIASVDFMGDDVAIFINQGNLTFSRGVLYGAGSGPVALCSVDLNGDGKQDIVVVNQKSSDLSVLLHAAR
ncbi:MAG: VCBS repeat-containing protein [Bryobacteraceae bacterium]